MISTMTEERAKKTKRKEKKVDNLLTLFMTKLLHSLKYFFVLLQKGVQQSSSAGLMVRWILIRHGKSTKKVLEIWKVSTLMV